MVCVLRCFCGTRRDNGFEQGGTESRREGAMREHIRILGWLHVVLNGMTALGVLLFWLVTSGMIAFLGASSGGHSGGFLLAGGFMMVLMGAIFAATLVGIAVGFGLLNRASWARIGSVVIGILHLASFPFGTALGVYTLWVMFNPETEALFRNPAS